MWAAGWARGVAVCQCCTVLAQRCHCQMLTSWVWLHSPSSKWASVYTEWTRLKKQADSGETVSRDVTGTVILLIWSMKDNFTFQVSFGLIFKGRTSLLCINDVWAHLFTTERQHLHYLQVLLGSLSLIFPKCADWSPLFSHKSSHLTYSLRQREKASQQKHCLGLERKSESGPCLGPNQPRALIIVKTQDSRGASWEV